VASSFPSLVSFVDGSRIRTNVNSPRTFQARKTNWAVVLEADGFLHKAMLALPLQQLGRFSLFLESTAVLRAQGITAGAGLRQEMPEWSGGLMGNICF